MTEHVLVVGAGPVGQSLSAGLSRAGLSVQRWCRSAGPLLAEATGAADIAVLAVRDDAIAKVAAQVVKSGVAGKETVLLHCAGALAPGEVLGAERGLVRGLGLLHPLRSLLGEEDLRGTVMALCGDEAGLAAAHRLAKALGGVPLPLAPEQLAAYHGAAALAAGHAAALLSLAADVLVAVGLDRRHAERALAALCASMAENVARVGLPAALTGPMARGDVETVRRHLTALPEKSPAAARLYLALAPTVWRLAEDKGGADKEALLRLRALLDLES